MVRQVGPRSAPASHQNLMAKKKVYVVVEVYRGRYRYLFGVFGSKKAANKEMTSYPHIKGLVALARVIR